MFVDNQNIVLSKLFSAVPTMLFRIESEVEIFCFESTRNFENECTNTLTKHFIFP